LDNKEGFPDGGWTGGAAFLFLLLLPGQAIMAVQEEGDRGMRGIGKEGEGRGREGQSMASTWLP